MHYNNTKNFQFPSEAQIMTSTVNKLLSFRPRKRLTSYSYHHKKFHNPIEIVCHACALMTFWAGLQKEMDKETLVQGVDTMFKIAVQLLSKKRRAVGQPSMLQDGDG